MTPEGWTSYEMRRPPSGVLCEFARLVGTDQSPGMPQEYGKWVGFVGDLDPYSNIVGLYWRLTGIGREYLDSLSPEVRMHVEVNAGDTQLFNLLTLGLAAVGAYSGANSGWFSSLLSGRPTDIDQVASSGGLV